MEPKMNQHKHISLNINVRGLGQSPTLAINERIKDMQRQGKKIYDFGLGQSPFPVPVPVVEALRLHAHEKQYLPVKGLAALKEAVASFHTNKDGVQADPDCVLVGPGSKELMFLLQLVFYGEIIVPTPCWVSYVPQAKILGKRISLIHTAFKDKWHISADRLTQLLEGERDYYRPRILVLNYPGNPDGLTYTADELRRIADVAQEYELILLSDEIYGQLNHEGGHISVARFYPEGTIISSGLSKWCGAGGWRLGTFTFPRDLDWLLEAMASVASESYTSVSAPIQYAAVEAFRGGISIERYLCHARRILSTLGLECYRILHEAGVRLHPPEGAFYLFPDLSSFAEILAKRGICDSLTFCENLLKETGVATLPGTAFERPANELTFRISYINFNGARALAASETVPLHLDLSQDFLEIHCDETLSAILKISEWLHKGSKPF
jgi:aspartate aminotransferase